MSDEMTGVVREKYGSVARAGLSSEQAGVRAVAEAFGYSADELAAIPAEANMGLSCGNPIAYARLRPGEVVVDLGSGGGLDVFLAAREVGPGGRAIGVDMTPDMIDLARRNAARGVGGKAIENAEFRLGPIDALPLDDATADVIVSNCVINLAPDKAAVFREMYRVLRPGGRVAVSDIVLKRPLPPEIATDVMAFVGCIAGAVSVEQYVAGLRAAGFAHVHVIDAGADLNAYGKVEGQAGCCGPAMNEKPSTGGLPVMAESGGCCGGGQGSAVHAGLGEVLSRYDINEYAASAKVLAVKPG